MSSISGMMLSISVDLEKEAHPLRISKMLQALAEQFFALHLSHPDWTDMRDDTPLAGPLPENGSRTMRGILPHPETGETLMQFVIAQTELHGLDEIKLSDVKAMADSEGTMFRYKNAEVTPLNFGKKDLEDDDRPN